MKKPIKVATASFEIDEHFSSMGRTLVYKSETGRTHGVPSPASLLGLELGKGAVITVTVALYRKGRVGKNPFALRPRRRRRASSDA